jgi:hypothetical protein
MGLLDEAIREHLELKRRSGADPGEIARLEQEALGPARREPVQPAPMPDEQEPEAAPAHEGASRLEDEPLYEDVYEPAEPDPAPAEHEREHEPGQATQQFSLAELEDAEDEVRDAPPPPTEEHQHPREADHKPDADVVPADEEPGADDVLEETPEFLQETPEHDRLWFEQKPPRDFDF